MLNEDLFHMKFQRSTDQLLGEVVNELKNIDEKLGDQQIELDLLNKRLSSVEKERNLAIGFVAGACLILGGVVGKAWDSFIGLLR